MINYTQNNNYNAVYFQDSFHFIDVILWTKLTIIVYYDIVTNM